MMQENSHFLLNYFLWYGHDIHSDDTSIKILGEQKGEQEKILVEQKSKKKCPQNVQKIAIFANSMLKSSNLV